MLPSGGFYPFTHQSMRYISRSSKKSILKAINKLKHIKISEQTKVKYIYLQLECPLYI